jgi:hypothetical protein
VLPVLNLGDLFVLVGIVRFGGFGYHGLGLVRGGVGVGVPGGVEFVAVGLVELRHVLVDVYLGVEVGVFEFGLLLVDLLQQFFLLVPADLQDPPRLLVEVLVEVLVRDDVVVLPHLLLHQHYDRTLLLLLLRQRALFPGSFLGKLGQESPVFDGFEFLLDLHDPVSLGDVLGESQRINIGDNWHFTLAFLLGSTVQRGAFDVVSPVAGEGGRELPLLLEDLLECFIHSNFIIACSLTSGNSIEERMR